MDRLSAIGGLYRGLLGSANSSATDRDLSELPSGDQKGFRANSVDWLNFGCQAVGVPS